MFDFQKKIPAPLQVLVSLNFLSQNFITISSFKFLEILRDGW